MAMARNGKTWIPWGSRDRACAANSSSPVEDPKSVRLFGVKLTNVHNFHKDLDYKSIDRMMMRKSISAGYLGLSAMAPAQRQYCSDMALGPQQNAALQLCAETGISKGGANAETQPGYASDGLMQTSSMSSRERRKGVPWTEEEHRLFLAGLQKLGKGDWRGISRNFVISRTPTQVASHAQKYFLRRTNLDKRKRRSSLFDIINSNPVSARSASNDDSQVKHWEVEMQHSGDASSSANSFPFPRAQFAPNLSADLCLGHLQQQRQEEEPRAIADDKAPSLRRSHQRRQSCGMPLKNPLSASMITELDKTVVASSSSQCTSDRSLSSSSSRMRIDEAPELSSLSLSIAPPLSSELALKLQPPGDLPVIPKDLLLIAGA